MEIKQQTKKKKSENDSVLMQDREGVQINNIDLDIEDLISTKKEDKLKAEKERKLKEAVQRDYLRVGDKYYKRVNQPDKNGKTHPVLQERQKSTIIDDVTRKGIRYVKKYEGECFVPSHVNYQQEIKGFYNMYHKVTHHPKEGKFDTISMVLNHVFGEHIDFIMDYMHLLYINPNQRLPIILLESKEKNTGKSTFGSLLTMIFQDNSIKLGNGDFESDFNAIWVNKLCIVVDETSLDKKGIMQMIKRMSTETGAVTSNQKNKAQTQVNFIGKFVFMSNDEGKALPIERGDPRFAVFKVPTFLEKGLKEDPGIEKKIVEEIPAFLYHLANMKPTFPEVGRMYFHPWVYQTKQLHAYYEGSQSYIAKAVQEFISHAFLMLPDETTIKYSLSDLLPQLSSGGYAKNCGRQQLKQALENELGMVLGHRQRYEFFNIASMDNGVEKYNSEQRNNCPYDFTRDQLKSAWKI